MAIEGEAARPWNAVAVALGHAAEFIEENNLLAALAGIGQAETATSAALANTAAGGEPDGT